MENKKTVVIGVTGGIAVYKALDVISRLRKENVCVHVIMTKAASEFVTPLSFQSMSQNIVIHDMFDEPKAWELQHISLAKKADLFAVIPATSNIIGKVANGIADDMLTTTIMATKAPVIFAPAMNVNMYNNPILQGNIQKLKAFGYDFIAPTSGRLACGDIGEGKLAQTEDIFEEIMSKLYPIKDMKGTKVLVTAGPTIAPIDPVRFITNRSTGKMGYAIAREARDRGAVVTLVSGPSGEKTPFGINAIKVNTNEEMRTAVIDNFYDSDIVIKAAAVSDFKPKTYCSSKIKKSGNGLNLEFVRDNDILKELGSLKKNQVLVGFAAESNDLLQNAQSKLLKKNLDYIIANDITGTDIGFGTEDNKVIILSKDNSPITIDKMPKKEVARELFDLINKKR
ncbi:bifunctional phosphopantothenoylcysteine decarboxylase/phosphopantothenate--cysteine ligase CoaBC [Clostridium sp. CM028]|uniref:bifunctional phosphopantothenoylcysteine decarboxylase/phosphopantothenate--cysteine ligase CoaBC n=1 Tax=unclassified Clostridium TaxID=2614128 RepID=UPI001C0E4DCB|nr:MULTISPECIES: bifunctional phosphopantothenoylcysteine decarboxylase/phosphopantothenate--cysteine ligase CoaBC [unclassified Clostridium]MBU3091592.1 bifunctional phosphopantothenoylcysteine decarboxylase/phosphopantothenate--cysteine ligase CoaBC [Clostridium sp. CF011]MBW9144143.1 bifunctional phosphopantothenoylcysteine decarboxylase/phosphopantothenate--cysteine ligase CoaBC [Clostridium sp. CM027]MBW9147546.1 bifunctional phosphopantothenoylcysteine decarboxylase/phosphopantothenate--cy